MKINMYKNQKGIGLLNVVLTMLILAVLAIYGLQIGMGYLDKNIIYKAVTGVLVEAKQNDYSEKTIMENISKRLSMNNVKVSSSDMKIENNGRGYSVKVDYTKYVTINDDISIVMNFEVEGSTP
jgi:Tfp pilus assembly protein PilX